MENAEKSVRKGKLALKVNANVPQVKSNAIIRASILAYPQNIVVLATIVVRTVFCVQVVFVSTLAPKVHQRFVLVVVLIPPTMTNIVDVAEKPVLLEKLVSKVFAFVVLVKMIVMVFALISAPIEKIVVLAKNLANQENSVQILNACFLVRKMHQKSVLAVASIQKRIQNIVVDVELFVEEG